MNTNEDIEMIANALSETILKALKNSIPNSNCPEFPKGDVPVAIAAKVYGENPTWVRAGIIAGWLPIGIATRNGKKITEISQMDSKQGRISYHISPKKLWEDTGFIWKG